MARNSNAKALSSSFVSLLACPMTGEFDTEGLWAGIDETTTGVLSFLLADRWVIAVLRVTCDVGEVERLRMGRIAAFACVAGVEVVRGSGGCATRNEDGR